MEEEQLVTGKSSRRLVFNRDESGYEWYSLDLNLVETNISGLEE